MSLTRIQAETELVDRAGAKMALAGMAVTIVGTNADLNGAMSVALRKMGLTASSTVVDGDLAALETDQVDEFLDRSELRLLENIQGNLDLTDIKVGQRSESLGQLADQVEKAITRLSTRLMREYGVGLGTLSGGTISLDFAEKLDDTVV